MKKAIVCILALTIMSCNKEETKLEVETAPVLIKVEAVHSVGDSVVSPIVLAR